MVFFNVESLNVESLNAEMVKCGMNWDGRLVEQIRVAKEQIQRLVNSVCIKRLEGNDK